jgi:hypothetical protein
MAITASQLRQNVYRLLDETVETGKPLEVRRKGHILRIVSDPGPHGKLSALVQHNCINGDPESLVSMDWSGIWDETGGFCDLS